MTAWGWKPPSNHSIESDLGITPQAPESHPGKGYRQIPAVFAGLDKAEALGYVSRLFDAAQAGAVLWGDKLLLKRFLEQCSRTGSKETQDGYCRELRHFDRRRDRTIRICIYGSWILRSWTTGCPSCGNKSRRAS